MKDTTLAALQAEQGKLYDSGAEQFDDIARHEDAKGELRRFLLEHFDFAGKRVLEAGAGTGRITDYYVDRAQRVVLTDAYESMVNILREKYAGVGKVTVAQCDHRQLRERFDEGCDIFLSAFSLNYAFDRDVEDCDAFLEKLLPPAKQHIVIEAGGLYEPFDFLPKESLRYARALENRFQKAVLRTEFVFSSPQQAYAAASALFSPIAERVKVEGRPVIPELINVYYDLGKRASHEKQYRQKQFPLQALGVDPHIGPP